MHADDKNWGGPYLQAAFFCERLLEESDGVMSAIRMVDWITVQAVDDHPKQSGSPVPIDLTFVISLKNGRAQGTRDLTVTMEPPIVEAAPQRFTQTVLFEGGEDDGVTVIWPIVFDAATDGVYWFAVYLGDRLLTRTPLRVAAPERFASPGPR